MVKIECDSCQSEIHCSDERHIVTVQSKCVIPQSPLVEESDADCIDEMAEQLEDGDTVEIPMVLPPMQKNYDLCRGCFMRYCKNPLGFERQRQYTVRRN